LSSAEGRKVQVGRLEIESICDESSYLIALGGELDADGCPTVESELTKAESNGGQPIVIDMRMLTFIDSTGIALLVAALRRSKEGSDRLRFISSDSEDVQRLLEICGLESRLPYLE
jgi:anti-sigma B factor antagonist